MMSEEEKFFYQLLHKTQFEFEKPPIYNKHGKTKNWHFAICNSPIIKGKGLVFRLNWGGRDHNKQTKLFATVFMAT
ncbi:hypothetical protein MNBD_BACTEROID03-479 [hydrothermal vent metagenome]|uniref:Uncharacterized protein n=1 Tax=hydrothermal vent metagenome TaxID=652676 RepID=A0A3B0TE51_9ZZZZ